MIKPKFKNNQKIYLICKGTSNNDIIESINKDIDNKKLNESSKSSLFSFYSPPQINKLNLNEIKKDEFPKLSDIGINELLLCKKNNINNTLFKTQLLKNNNIYTSLDYDAIESTLVLFNEINNLVIYPLPYITENSYIKNEQKFDIFKKKFGDYSIDRSYNRRIKEIDNYIKKLQNEEYTYRISTNIMNEYKLLINKKKEWTETKNYWKNKKTVKDFINKKNNITIDWKNTYNKKNLSLMVKYNIFEFKKQFEKIILDKYKNETDTNSDIPNIIIVCSHILIRDMLKLFKQKFNSKVDIIERSSIWELNFDLKFNMKDYKLLDKKLEYINYKKIYPIEYNYEPLKYNSNNNKFYFNYNNAKFPLFNSKEQIPFQYIEKIKLETFVQNKKNTIIKTLKKIKIEDGDNKETDKNNTLNILNTMNNSKNIRFENLK